MQHISALQVFITPVGTTYSNYTELKLFTRIFVMFIVVWRLC